MKQETYICRSVTPDGTLRSIGTITIEGDRIIHSEHRLLDSEEELKRRRDAISARCVFYEE